MFDDQCSRFNPLNQYNTPVAMCQIELNLLKKSDLWQKLCVFLKTKCSDSARLLKDDFKSRQLLSL